MQKATILIGAASLLLLGGCEKAAAPAPAKTDSTVAPVKNEATDGAARAASSHRFSSWFGKWVGPEGMYVTIAAAGPGRYKLEMQSDLDTKGIYDGEDSAHGIQFRRGDEHLSLTRARGDETGLKWLADKAECLKVKDGEGYCRD